MDGGVVAEVARSVTDFRVPYLVRYPPPLWAVLMVIYMAAASGVVTAVQIADYWAANRQRLEKIFGSEFPRRNISHDTARRILMQLDSSEDGKYLRRLFRVILGLCIGLWRNRLVALDGQACRSSKTESGKPHYTLSVVDCDLRITFDQVQVGAKSNEIHYATEVLEALDLNGCTVAADALHMQNNLVDLIVEKGGDYCLSLKAMTVSKKLFQEVQLVADLALTPENFAKQQTKSIDRIPVKTKETYEEGHGRIEKREFYAIPASWIDEAQNWAGLSTGTIFVVKSEKTHKASAKTGKAESTERSIRYFATTFLFDGNPYLMEQGIRSIRQRWGIESTHWELDVQMRQDMVQMSNIRYIRAQRMLSRIGRAIIRHIQMNFERIHGTEKNAPSVESSMIYARDPEFLIRVFEDISDNGGLQELLKAED